MNATEIAKLNAALNTASWTVGALVAPSCQPAKSKGQAKRFLAACLDKLALADVAPGPVVARDARMVSDVAGCLIGRATGRQVTDMALSIF